MTESRARRFRNIVNDIVAATFADVMRQHPEFPQDAVRNTLRDLVTRNVAERIRRTEFNSIRRVTAGLEDDVESTPDVIALLLSMKPMVDVEPTGLTFENVIDGTPFTPISLRNPETKTTECVANE